MLLFKRKIQTPKTLMLCRTDNIGDVTLTLPMAAWIKEHYPNTRVLFLARTYVQDAIELSPHVDQFIDWTKMSAKSNPSIIADLQALNVDAIIHVRSDRHLAAMAKAAKIKWRIAAFSGRYFSTSNVRPVFSRSRTIFSGSSPTIHQAQSSFHLLKPLGLKMLPNLIDLTQTPVFRPLELTEKLKKIIDPNRFTLIIHPLSNGNGRQWPLSHFVSLLSRLDTTRIQVLVTGSEKEGALLSEPLFEKCPKIQNLCGRFSLKELITCIQHADGLIASSTGPLHVAAACGTRTLGLFPKRERMHAGYWGPIGTSVEALTSLAPCPGCTSSESCLCMRNLEIDQVQAVISRWAKKARRIDFS